MSSKKIPFNADLIEAFSGMFLSPRYDDPRPTAEFHRKAWALYCSDLPRCMVIAPRDHAKSTALTFDYVLAEVLFKQSRYVILIGSTEAMAQEQLGNITGELHDNEDLRKEFGIEGFITDSKTDIIVKMDGGHTFRIVARGAEQRIRGLLWDGKRPDLVVCDDMEDDEQVENSNRRLKFKSWFFRAARQSLSKKGKIRVHGTILHEDSLLSRLRKNSMWTHLFFKAHESFDDFSNILWPERWTEKELRDKRQEFIDDMDSAGYSQEILNDPQDNAEAYLRREDFIAMTYENHDAPKAIVAGYDFAVSKSDKANRSSITIGGKEMNNIVDIVDQHVGRWDSLELIEKMFEVEAKWSPQYHFVEDGVIWKGLYPMIRKEMQLRDIWLNFHPIASTKDKATRGRPYQKRMRAGCMRFDKEADWYAGYEMENLKFTGTSDAKQDDQFDSTSILVKGLDLMGEVEEEDFYDDEQEEFYNTTPSGNGGRSVHTGY